MICEFVFVFNILLVNIMKIFLFCYCFKMGVVGGLIFGVDFYEFCVFGQEQCQCQVCFVYVYQNVCVNNGRQLVSYIYIFCLEIFN